MALKKAVVWVEISAFIQSGCIEALTSQGHLSPVQENPLGPPPPKLLYALELPPLVQILRSAIPAKNNVTSLAPCLAGGYKACDVRTTPSESQLTSCVLLPSPYWWKSSHTRRSVASWYGIAHAFEVLITSWRFGCTQYKATWWTEWRDCPQCTIYTIISAKSRVDLEKEQKD